MAVKGVCFDVGGTLVVRDGPTATARVAAALGADVRDILEPLKAALHRAPGTPDEASARLCRELGIEDASVRGRVAAALAAPVGPARPTAGAAEALAWCRRAGLKLATLSNCASFEAVDVQTLFGSVDAVHDSWHTGVCKPDAKAFEEVARALAIEPGAMVHVGDDPIADVEGAIGAGWRAILVGATALERGRRRVAIRDLGELPAVLERWEGAP